MEGQKLKQLRLAKGWTLEELSKQLQQIKVKVTPAAISKYERNLINPGNRILAGLVEVYNTPIDVLFAGAETTIEPIRYRKHSTLSKNISEMLENSGILHLEKCNSLLEKLHPEELKKAGWKRYSINSLEGAEKLAETLREKWELGPYQVNNLSTVIEQKNIFLYPVGEERYFGGLSFLSYNSRKEVTGGLIMYNSNSPGERQRFSIAHELGHLLIVQTDDYKFDEKVANRFASAFLLPSELLLKMFGDRRSNITMNELQDFKKYFGVSMQALIYRLRELDIISKTYCETLFKYFSLKGWRKKEPGELSPETPSIYKLLVERAYSENMISAELMQNFYGITPATENETRQTALSKLLALPRGEREEQLRKQMIAAAKYYETDEELKEFREARLVGEE